MILNFRKAEHLFQNYRDFVSVQRQSDSPSDLCAMGTKGSSSQIMEFLMSQLSPEQRQMFEQLQSFSAEAEGGDAPYGQLETE
jgi:hypothetical protein